MGQDIVKKCGYEAEDGYQLDGHLWSEHEDEDDLKSFVCQHCDKSFSNLKDLMIHKKSNHVEYVSICFHFSNGACPYDETCWFRHEIKSREKNKELTFICNVCKTIFESRNDLMMHKKKEHEGKIEMCKFIKKGNCTYDEKCWFSHKKDENLTN